jgi:ATP-binding cassette subfamily B protein/subfamily B ATP-binding cassette protein MsbA
MIQILRAMWPYLRPYRGTLFLALAAMLGETVTALLAPWPLKYVFDRILLVNHHHGGAQLRITMGSAQWRLLAIITGAAILIAAADALLTYFDSKLSEVAAQKAVYELRRTLFGHLQRLSLAFHQSADTRLGDLLSRLSGDIGALQDLAAEGVSNIVTNGLTLAAMMGVLCWLDWPMAAAAFVLTIPTAVYAQRNTKVMRQALRSARRQEGHVSAMIQESLSYVKLVQAFGREEQEARRLSKASDRSLGANIRAATLLARLAPSVSLMSDIGYALLTVLGVERVVRGNLTPGELLVLLSYVRGTQSPIRQLAKLSYSVSKAGAGLERIQEVLDLEPTIRELPSAVPLRLTGPASVDFSDVTFGYKSGRPVLQNVTVHVAPGELIAIVGATGSGKSTLLSLLPRFYDPWAGSVAIAGRDVRDFTLKSLRANIGLVLQESLILRTTVLDNIAYGRPGASRAEVIAAAEASGAAMVAARLEDGYDTMVSERGASLSGGEKQCIGIARAMLKNAPIVMLDEPTSAMDAHTERLVMAGIERLLRNRTGFIIAHRLATVMKADRVLVLDQGRVVESGPPGSLLADPGSRFASLAQAQLIAGQDRETPSPGRDARMARSRQEPAYPGRPRRAATLIPLQDAVQAGYAEGFELGAAAARNAPERWLATVLSRKPLMPMDLQAGLFRGSSLPSEWLQHEDVRHALQRGFWDGMERNRWRT